MARTDECEVPTRLGDNPPVLPFRKPFDLNAWQVPTSVITVVLVLNLEQWVPLPDEPFQTGAFVSPMILARVLALALGLMIVFVEPKGRLIPVWLWVACCHFVRGISGYVETGDDAVRYYPPDVEAMTRMRLEGEASVRVVDPPLWPILKRTPFADSYWKKYVPYRLSLIVEPQGALELMTDNERAGRWHSLAGGLRALSDPIQIVAQTRSEDAQWLAERAMPPVGSPLADLREDIRAWALKRAESMVMRRIVVTCSSADPDVLTEHVRDTTGMLVDAGLTVRPARPDELASVFNDVYGGRAFYPRKRDAFGIDGTDYVTIAVRHFPRSVVVGWVMFIIGRLPVDMSLFIEPDDASWLTRNMDWFGGMTMLDAADTAHHDAHADLARVEGKVKRTEDSVQRTTLLLTMPRNIVPRVSNRLRKAGAIYRQATFEHQAGRFATLPIGGRPLVGATRPLDGDSVAACYPFGSAGLRMARGALIGVSRDSPEAVTIDLRDAALLASMVVIVGTTGAGKTVLMQILIARSALPFVIIDMKPHIDEQRHGDFYRFTMAAKGNYHVCRSGQPLPVPHPTAQCYNLADLSKAERAATLQSIAEQEWQRAVASLDDRIFAIDEANELGKTEEGKNFIERIVSQGRSVGFIGIAATQEVGDFLAESRMAKAVTMSSVQFVLAQEFSNVDNVSMKLRLGGEATAELRKFQPTPGDDESARNRYAIVRVGQRMCSIRIEASPAEIALFTTKPSDKRERAQHGRKYPGSSDGLGGVVPVAAQVYGGHVLNGSAVHR